MISRDQSKREYNSLPNFLNWSVSSCNKHALQCIYCFKTLSFVRQYYRILYKSFLLCETASISLYSSELWHSHPPPIVHNFTYVYVEMLNLLIFTELAEVQVLVQRDVERNIASSQQKRMWDLSGALAVRRVLSSHHEVLLQDRLQVVIIIYLWLISFGDDTSVRIIAGNIHF